MGKKFVNSFKKTIFTSDLNATVKTPICIIRTNFSK